MIEAGVDLLGLGGIAGIGGGGYAWWQATANKKMIDKLEERVEQVKIKLNEQALYAAQHYASNMAVRELGEKLETHLVRIEDKLDRKQDKA